MMTKMRTVRDDGRPCLGFTGRPEEAPAGCRPWFELSGVPGGEAEVIFGHWANLGLYRHGPVTCLDSGCVYGGSLSALRLGDGTVVQQPRMDGPLRL
jgi:bis(5'-nucleosyl)-tetraphosphatase (symmetrical)